MIGLRELAVHARASWFVRACPARPQPRASLAAFARFLLVPGLMLAGHASAQSCGVGQTPLALGFTGGEQTATVPAGVHSLTVYLSGAQGGAGRSGAGSIGGSPNSPGGAGGLGGRVRGTLAVTPGATLSVWVGGQGSQAVNAGGLGQGTDGIGGGATDLRVGGNGVGNRVGIAGGGGGGGNAGWSTANVIAGGAGGVGGGGVGGAGATVPGGPGPFGGGGGAVGTGGAAGAGCGGFPATAGNAATGKGGNSNNFSGSFIGAGYGGGGGGGATIGAGGGGAGVGTTGCQQNWNGGGGGGSGGASGATGLTAVTINNGVQAGNGAALICFSPTEFSVGGTASGQTGAVTLQLAATNPASSQQTVVAAGAGTFAFPIRLPQGANWNVSVLSAPPGQTCSVNPSSGAAINADVTNVALTCTTVTTTISPPTLPNGAFNVAYSQTFSASSANGGVGPYTFSVSAGALPAGLSLSSAGVLSGTPTASGSFNFTVQATSSNGFSGTQAYTLAIAQATQTITAFAATPAAPVYTPGGTFTVSATGGASGNPVVFASTSPAVCTVVGNTVTMQGAGNCALTADQAGNANYGAAPQATLTVAIGAASQTITNFVATPAAPVYAPGGTFAVSATGGASGNPVVFASTSPAVCTVAGSTVTMQGAGNCALTADQAGNANYGAAPQVSLAVTIGAASQTISNFVATPAAPVYAPGGTFAVSATGGGSGNPVVFASTSPAVCTVSGGTVTMLGAGSCALTADQAGDANYDAAPQATLAVTIGMASQAISAFVANPAAPVYAPGGTFTVSATGGASGNPVVFATTSAAVCTVSGSTVTMLGAGNCALTADQAGNADYSAAPQATLTVAIGAGSQMITNFAANPAAPVYAPGGTFTVSATPGPSTSPVVFASTTAAVCTVSGNTVSMLAAGNCALTANQAADANYDAAPQADLNVVIGAAAQTISNFAANPAAPVYAPGGTFTVSATGGASGNPVVFASTTAAVCTVSGNTVSMVAAGTCSLTANQAGNANYAAAPQVALDVAIATADQTITNFAATPASPVYTPNGTFTVSATGGASGNPVVFASTTASVCTVSGNIVRMVTAGTCSLTADQAGNADYSAAPQATLDVTITAASQTITDFTANPAAPVYTPGGTFTVSATPGASTSPVVFASTTTSVCTVSGSTVTMLTAGTCSLTANQAGDANYSASPQVTLDVVIGAATQTITQFVANPAAPVYSPGGTFAVSATGGASGNPVVFASTSPTICTVSGSTVTMLNAGTCALTANQAGNASYSAAPQVALQVTIGGATPELTWIDDLVKMLGEAAFDLPDPGSDSSGAFTFTSSNAAVATVSGRRVTIVGPGVATLVATQAASGNYLQGSISAKLTVADRPDPTRDPSVVGGLQAQVDASVRFASAQQTNVQDRLRQQRFASANSSSNGLNFSRSNGLNSGVSMSAGQVAPIDGSRLPKGLGLWTAGTVTSGQRDPNGRSDGFDFSSDGVTLGADWRFNDRFLFGVAGGLGWNDTDLDDARSRLDAKQRALSLYGLWRPAERWFVDGIVGWGQLDFDLRRYSAVADATGTAQRDGDQAYGSLTVGYEHGTAGASSMMLTGYGHLDASRTKLDSYRERGLGIYDLSYGEQTVDDSGASLGVEGSFQVVTAHDNVFRPYWMLEYRESLENSSEVKLNYVVMPAANDYVLGLRSYGDNAFTYGAGMDMEMTNGWRLSFLLRRQNGSGQDPSTSFGLLLSYAPIAQSPSSSQAAPTAQDVMTQLDARARGGDAAGDAATSTAVPVTGH